ncbi:hypothetical protein ACI0FM_02920 [Paenochrobactrum sp. BZR 588]|uniref:hypothetical protein n=1 Tax=unclassified Paenochrobactrum TaxID=2639760 RepID=UPI003854604E
MNADEKLGNAIADIQVIADIMTALQDAAGNKCHRTDLLVRNLKQCATEAEDALEGLLEELDAEYWRQHDSCRENYD